MREHPSLAPVNPDLNAWQVRIWTAWSRLVYDDDDDADDDDVDDDDDEHDDDDDGKDDEDDVDGKDVDFR